MKRRPKVGEKIEVSTWATGFKGVFGPRDFCLKTADGEELACAHSLWVYVDTESGRPVKPNQEEINNQIADKEKEYVSYEKKIDTLLAAEKPIKRELALIRQNAKQLPAILGGESYLKISEKNLNKLMEMAQGAGTLKNLNVAYEKELSVMKKTIATRFEELRD